MSVYNDSNLLRELGWNPSALKTMSKSIKSILEQGVLLEQALINHKNRILEQKANRANFNEEANESFISESSKCSEENRLNEKSVNDTNQPNSINETDKSETESHTSNSDSVGTNKPLGGLVKLVDQAQLMDLNVNSAVFASQVSQFVTSSSNALKHSLLFTDEHLIVSESLTSCADGTMTSAIAESDLQELEGTNICNVDKYPNVLTQDNQNLLLTNSIQNRNSPNILLPFNLLSIKRENDLPVVMPSPIIVKNEQKPEDSGLDESCMILNITSHSSDNIDVGNVKSTDGNGLHTEVDSFPILDNVDLTKTVPPNSIYVSCRTRLTENIISKFFKARGLEVIQYKKLNLNNLGSGIVLLKNSHDVKMALKINNKFLIDGTPLRIKRYYCPKVQKDSKCMKGKKNKKKVNASKSMKNKKKPGAGPSKNNSTKKQQLKARNEHRSNMAEGRMSNNCISQNMQNALNLPETNTVSFENRSAHSQHMGQHFSSQGDTMDNVKQADMHPNKEMVDCRNQSNVDSSYIREQGNRTVNRQPTQRQHRRQFFNNRYPNNCHKEFKRQSSRDWSMNEFDRRENQPLNQRRGSNQNY